MGFTTFQKDLPPSSSQNEDKKLIFFKTSVHTSVLCYTYDTYIYITVFARQLFVYSGLCLEEKQGKFAIKRHALHPSPSPLTRTFTHAPYRDILPHLLGRLSQPIGAFTLSNSGNRRDLPQNKSCELYKEEN